MQSYHLTSSSWRESLGRLSQFRVLGSENSLLDQVVLRVVLCVVLLVVLQVVLRVGLQVMLALATRLACATHVAWARTSSSKLPETAVSAIIS